MIKNGYIFDLFNMIMLFGMVVVLNIMMAVYCNRCKKCLQFFYPKERERVPDEDLLSARPFQKEGLLPIRVDKKELKRIEGIIRDLRAGLVLDAEDKESSLFLLEASQAQVLREKLLKKLKKSSVKLEDQKIYQSVLSKLNFGFESQTPLSREEIKNLTSSIKLSLTQVMVKGFTVAMLFFCSALCYFFLKRIPVEDMFVIFLLTWPYPFIGMLILYFLMCRKNFSYVFAIWNRICGALGKGCKCGEVLTQDSKGRSLEEKVKMGSLAFTLNEEENQVLTEFLNKCSEKVQMQWREMSTRFLAGSPLREREGKQKVQDVLLLRKILLSAIFEDGFNGGNLLPDGSLIKRDRYELSDDYSLTPQGKILMGILERLYS